MGAHHSGPRPGAAGQRGGSDSARARDRAEAIKRAAERSIPRYPTDWKYSREWELSPAALYDLMDRRLNAYRTGPPATDQSPKR